MTSLPVVQEHGPNKPKFGEACNGCGFCCAAEVCTIGVEFLKTTVAPCPALEWEGGRFWCGMMRRPGHYLGLSPFAAGEIDASVETLHPKLLAANQHIKALRADVERMQTLIDGIPALAKRAEKAEGLLRNIVIGENKASELRVRMQRGEDLLAPYGDLLRRNAAAWNDAAAYLTRAEQSKETQP